MVGFRLTEPFFPPTPANAHNEIISECLLQRQNAKNQSADESGLPEEDAKDCRGIGMATSL